MAMFLVLGVHTMNHQQQLKNECSDVELHTSANMFT